MWASRRRVQQVQALLDIDLDVPRGEVLGIVGANGAGKSTLLRAIAGIVPPERGRIEIRGRISTLLSLGVGFNRSLSGRDNVLLGGLAAGLDPEDIRSRYDEIAEFAELGEHMERPMKTYSSGMSGRLAFSVAVHMNPDILLIDEALATGDAAFKAKSSAKMQELCANAGTILLVSHGLAVIRDLATECVWLHRGQLMSRGDPEEVIADYATYAQTKQHAPAIYDDE
jgi:ABC-type polysaccharide/polyol phosphate transport system ATPase subunit